MARKKCHHNYNKLSEDGKFLICRCGKKVPRIPLKELLNEYDEDNILPGANDL